VHRKVTKRDAFDDPIRIVILCEFATANEPKGDDPTSIVTLCEQREPKGDDRKPGRDTEKSPVATSKCL
jgi:hypothetical protein